MKPMLLTIVLLLTTVLCPAFTACDRNDDPITTTTGSDSTEESDDNTGDAPGDNNDDNTETPEQPMTLTLEIGNSTFTATLEENATARAFTALLPLTLSMYELNNNEKYAYLDQSLPTQTSSPGTIQAGDLMLYGSSCVVLFYKSFSTSYNYTRIGRIVNASGLAAAVGSSHVTVSFDR